MRKNLEKRPTLDGSSEKKNHKTGKNETGLWWFIANRGEERLRITPGNLRNILRITDRANSYKIKNLYERVEFIEALIGFALPRFIREVIIKGKAAYPSKAFRRGFLQRGLGVPSKHSKVFNEEIDNLVKSGEIRVSRTGGWYRYV